MLMVAPLPRLMFDDELSEPAAPPTPHEEEVEQVPELVTMPSRFERSRRKAILMSGGCMMTEVWPCIMFAVSK